MAAQPATAPWKINVQCAIAKQMVLAQSTSADEVKGLNLYHEIEVSALNEGRSCDKGQHRHHLHRLPYRFYILMIFQ
jgi:hypothetical protein